MNIIFGLVDSSFKNTALQIVDAAQGLPTSEFAGCNTGRTASAANRSSGKSFSFCHDEADCLTGYLGEIHWTEPDLSAYAEDRGDAATISLAYRKYGAELMQVIRGHHVLAIIDRKERRCLLATDRFGTHTVYYTTDGNSALSFSSSLSTITEKSEHNFPVNTQALFDYTYLHVVPSPDTIYKGVYKLEPAQLLVFYKGEANRSFHWLPTFTKTTDRSTDTLKRQLAHLLEQAVARNKPDETTGCFLSGGLDSSTVTGVHAGLSSSQINAFSIGFSEEGFDEIPYARIAARHFKARLHEYYITPDDIVESIPLIGKTYDEPFGNSSAVPALYCARLARQHGITRMLAGDGGDELFGGNERYAKQKIFQLYHGIPSLLRKGLLEPLFLSSPAGRIPLLGSKVRSYINQARLDMPERLESYNFLKRTPLETVFDPDFLGSVDTSYPDSVRSATWNRIHDGTLLDHMLYIDWKQTLADNDLPKVSRMCELAGVEVHYPMLDDDLVEFSTTIPSNLALKGQNLRYFYKLALADFLPREIINKSKHGFGLPFGQWLKTSNTLKELVYSNLQAAKERKIFCNEFIDKLVTLHEGGHASYYGSMVWVIVMLEEWLKQHGL